MSNFRGNFFTATRNALLQANEDNNKEALSALKELVIFLKRGDYSTSTNLLNFMDDVFKGKTHAEISDEYGISVSTVSNALSKYSKLLYGLFGNDFFPQLLNPITTQKARERMEGVFRAYELNMAQVLEPAMLRKVLREKPDTSIDLNTCVEEIKFLAKYNRIRMHEDFAKLDKAKFTRLIHSLSSKEDNSSNPVNISIVRNLL